MRTADTPTRLVQAAVPTNALEGDVLLIQTEIGLFEVPIRAKSNTLRPGKQIHVDIPVPADFDKSRKLAVGGTEVRARGARPTSARR